MKNTNDSVVKALTPAEVSEKITAKLSELNEVLTVLEKNYHRSEVLTPEERGEKEELAKQMLSDLNDLSEMRVWLTWKAKKNPILEAVKNPRYDLYQLKETRRPGESKDNPNYYLTLKPKTKEVPLYKLAEYCKSSTEWISKAQAFELVLYLQGCDDMLMEAKNPLLSGQTKEFFEHMIDLNTAYLADPKNTKNPFGMATMKKSLDEVVQSALGEKYHCQKQDICYLQKTYFSKSKKQRRQLKEEKHFDSLLLEVFDRIVHNGVYTSMARDAEIEKARKALEKEEEREKQEKAKAKGKGKGQTLVILD